MAGVAPPSCCAEAVAAKEAGNKAFQAGNYEEALACFTEAVRQDPCSALLRSNRAGALASLGQHTEALSEAEICVNLQPDWWKGHSRKGHAQFNLGRNVDSERSFREANRLNPTEQSVLQALARFGDTSGSSSTLPGGATSNIPSFEHQATGPLIWESTDLAAAPAVAVTFSAPTADAASSQTTDPEALRQNGTATSSSDPPSKQERLSRGEKLLETRRCWLEEWDAWDNATLLRRLRTLGWDAEGYSRDDIVEVLLQAETDNYLKGWCNQKGLQAIGLVCTGVSIMGTFGALSLWFVVANS